MINKIKISGVAYDVELVADLEDGDRAYYGRINHQELLLEIEKNQKPEIQIQSLLHEALHGLFHQTGHIDIEDEERIVCMLGCQLPKFLRDNPDLVKLLLDSADGK